MNQQNIKVQLHLLNGDAFVWNADGMSCTHISTVVVEHHAYEWCMLGKVTFF